MSIDLVRFTRALVDKVKATLAPIEARLEVLERRSLMPGPQGDPGESGLVGPMGPCGEKGDPGDCGPMGEKGESGAAGPIGPCGEKGDCGPMGPMGPAGQDGAKGLDGLHGKDGAPGRDAEPVDLDAIVKAAAALIPLPKDGRDGINGQDVDADLAVARVLEKSQTAMAAAIEEAVSRRLSVAVSDAVTKAIAALPVPKDGAPGRDGTDGVGLTGALVTEDGSLMLTLSDGSTKAAGRVAGAPGRDGLPGRTGEKGADGRDGLDGLGFDDLEQTYDGERRITLAFRRGERVKTMPTIVLPATIYRGVFVEGAAYERGDQVTWGGSQWIAKEATSAKPGLPDAASRAWVLAVKAGRDGKDGKPGKDGAPGRDGKDAKPGW